MQESSNIFSRIDELLDFLEIKEVANGDFTPNFPMRVPLSYATKMEKGNSQDPLLLQVLPTLKEKLCIPGFQDDPVGDKNAETCEGILKKYQGRILLIAGNACSVRCRFCFRRNSEMRMPKQLPENLQKVLGMDSSIKEVIFSGGDPFMTPISLWEKLFQPIVLAKAVRTIRIHSRVPLTEPERALNYLPFLKKYSERFHYILVLHTNHPNELSGKTEKVLQEFKNAGVHLLNQSVLLKGINDNPETLVSLSEKLFECGVLPYYLHMLDKANGCAHFEVSETKAKEIYKELLEKLPGYLVPKIVREIPKEKSKTPIF